MSDVPVCLTTRSGPGCGHPTADHDGNPLRPCDCCSRAEEIRLLTSPMNRTQRRALQRSLKRAGIRG